MQSTKDTSWSGYKKATIIISIISIIVISLQTIYTHFYSQSWKEIEFLSNEKERKLKKLDKLLSVPKVKLSINTLKEAGLSSRLLQSISTIPSTVSLKHYSGETAKGVRVDIHISEPLIKYEAWNSSESFRVIRIEGENILRLEADKIRKGTSIGVTILTKKVPELNTDILIDKGEIVKKNNISPKIYRNSMFNDKKVVKNNISNIIDYIKYKTMFIGDDLNEIDKLKHEIRIIDNKISSIREQTIIKWIGGWFSNDIILLMSVIFIGGLPIFISLYRGLKNDLLKRDEYKKIPELIEKGDFLPNTIQDIIIFLRKPDDLQINDKSNNQLSLIYFKDYYLLGNKKGIKFIIQDGKVKKIIDEESSWSKDIGQQSH